MTEEPNHGREDTVERLTDHDRRIVRETLGELERATPPAGGATLGWLAGLVGLLVLVVWPRIAERVPGGDFVSPFVLLVGALLLLGGPVLALLGGRGGARAAEAAVEAALRRLEDPGADRETVVRASTLLLAHAYVSRGPTTVHTFEPDEAASRIGDRLPVVEAVERHLVEESVTYPVFSLADEEG